jgi:spore maturation protein CgeB
VAGPLYPAEIEWPGNVERIEHLEPARHRGFYNAQRSTLNITRADMRLAGYSPSVRLFEAAACATPIVSDYWNGLESIFQPDREILVARGPGDVLRYLRETPPEELAAIGRRARASVLGSHTAAHRAEELECHAAEAMREFRNNG